MIRWLLASFFTFILLFCSVARYLAACILREYLSVCSCLSCTQAFWIKINRIDKQKFSGVARKTSLIFHLRISTNNILNRRGKKLHQFFRKMDEKKKKKSNRCSKALCVNTQTQKLAKIFGNIYILITFI